MNLYAQKVNNFKIAKPVLKWAGGKSLLLPQLSQHFPNKLKCGAVKRYIEPFVGSGAVFFEIFNTYYFKEAYLLDTNPELIILYKVIQQDVNDLIKILEQLQNIYLSTPEQKQFYYQIREEYNGFDKDIKTEKYQKSFIRRAALTIFLNKTCFNGLFRVNSKGLFNVPMGKYKNPKILNKTNLKAVSEALQYATIIQADFSTALNYMDQDTFVYYDPPYRPIKTSSFNSYTTNTFDDNEQYRLKALFDKGNNLGALQMLSNSDPTNFNRNDLFFDKLYGNYKINRIWAKRLINATPDGRGVVRELLITNYES